MAKKKTQSKGGTNVSVVFESGNRPYQIIATLLMCGAIVMVAYALAKNGWMELAATMVTMFLFQLVRLLAVTGMLRLPKNTSTSFQGTRGFIRTAYDEFVVWQASSPIWRLAALAAGYTLLFMLGRWLITLSLGVFTNIWIAGAAGAVIASLIIFPSLLGGVLKKLTRRPDGVEDEEAEKPADDLFDVRRDRSIDD